MTITPDRNHPHFAGRMLWAAENLEPVEPRYCLVSENGDGPATITVPSKPWMAMALAGDFLPGWEDMRDETKRNYAPPIGPMTEEEAMEYLVKAALPRELWENTARRNRMGFAICRIDQIPTSREWRNAWRLADEF
jgi:hypothetical protein